MIKVYNRNSRQYEVEKVAGSKMMNFIYGNRAGGIGLELLIKRKIYSSFTGMYCDMRLSKRMINSFIRNFDIDMSGCKKDIGHFETFNEFFTRQMNTEARSFKSSSDVLTSPGDGRLKAWENIDVNKLVQIKGSSYSLKELINNHSLAGKYDKGICLLLRLAPVDYHRFHFIDEGICGKSERIKGAYYSVNPVALEKVIELFCKNKREFSIFHSRNFGDVLYVEVGATSVGSIVQSYVPEKPIQRGDEKGYFKFGGSTVILFLENGAASIDKEILMQTELGFETKVLAGEPIGAKGTVDN